MSNQIPPEMAEAARLTRLGKLMEATTLIQRVLRGGRADAKPPKRGVIDADESAIDPDPHAERLEPKPEHRHTFRPHAGLRETIWRVMEMAKEFRVDAITPTEPVQTAKGALFLNRTYANAAGERAFKLYVPSRMSERPALIVMLHGCTQTPDDFAVGTRMNALAEEHGFLVLYPEQSSRANGRHCWNWFRPEDQRRGDGEPSLIAGITQEVMNEYGIDPNRVYIAGLSAGGAAAAIMGDVYPDLYKAVGVHSGLPSAAARDLGSAFDAMRLGVKVRPPSERRDPSEKLMPTIVFHGEKDYVVNPSNGDAVAARVVGGVAGLRRETEEGQVEGGRAYVRTSFADETGRTVCEHWRIRDGGHAWSGGSRAGSHTDPLGPDASKEMVRFFFQH